MVKLPLKKCFASELFTMSKLPTMQIHGKVFTPGERWYYTTKK